MATISKQVGKSKTTYKVRIRKPNNPTITKTFSSKSIAEKWARKTELELEEGTYLDKQQSASHTISDVVNRYLQEELHKLAESDWPTRTRQLNWWKQQIGSKTLNNVSPSLLIEQRNQLKNEYIIDSLGRTTNRHRSGSTVNRYMAALSSALTIAITEWQWLDSNPFSRIRNEKESNSRTRYLTPDERTALLSSCKSSQNKYLYLITVLALSTGMRQAEIMSLTYKQLDFARNKITLYKTKNGETRVVPLVGLAAKELQAHSKVRDINNPYVFPSSKPNENNKTSARFPRSAWESAITEAEISDFTFHDCRHSAASELAMNGASLHEIAAVLGHKTLAMVQRYAHLSEAHTIAVVEKMNSAIFGDDYK